MKMISFFLFLSISTALYCSLWYDEQKISDCRLKNLGGSQPIYTCGLREFLKKVNETKQQGPTGYAMLFYGRHGVGKTENAKIIAEESGALLHIYNMNTIVTGRLRDTKNCTRVIDRMHDIFRKAEFFATETQQPVIIVLDEIDVLVSKKREWRRYIFALLRCELDKHKDNPFITIILTCNSYQGIDEALVDRCIRIKWYMPTVDDRKEIIKLLASKNQLPLSEEFVEKLAQNTRDFTGRHFVEAFEFCIDSTTEKNIPITPELLKQAISHIQSIINKDKSWNRWWAETVFFFL